MAISQEQVKVPGLPLQARDQLVAWPLPRSATVASRGGWGRHAAHKTKQGQAALAACGVGWDPVTRKSRRWFLLPSRPCVWRLRESLSTWGARIRRLAGSTVVTATLEEKIKKAKILYWKQEQLMRLQKQAEKNVEKKTSRSTEILKTQGLLV
nr:large ribosomal subunit protein uL13-like [Kogia breviceps]